MIIRLIFFCIAVLFLPKAAFTQNTPKADKLIQKLRTAQSDSEKVHFLLQLSDETRSRDIKKALDYANEALSISKAVSFQKGIAGAYNNLANIYDSEGDLEKALNYYEEAAKMYERLNDSSGVVKPYHNLGMLYSQQGNYGKSLNYYLKALKIKEVLGNKNSIALTLMGIGVVYYDKKQIPEASAYFQKAYRLFEEVKNDEGLAMVSVNISNIHADKKETDISLEYLIIAREKFEKSQNLSGVAYTLINIGSIYMNDRHDLNKAREYLNQALKIQDEVEDAEGIVNTYISIGKSYFMEKRMKEGEEFTRKALSMAKETGMKYAEKDAYYSLSKAYADKQDFRKAYYYLENYSDLKDTIYSSESSWQIAEMQTKYETEKKEKEIKLQKAELREKEVVMKQQTIQRNAFIGGFILMIVIAAIIFQSFRNKSKANKIISRQKQEVELQKHIVEEKQKEILDSINYAKRIQEAILPSRTALVHNLKNGFVLFRPKDVVSGDFYWLETFGNKVFFAAADCTGHGVPGALVSMVCSHALSKSLLEERITDTGKILDRTRELVIERFAKSGEEVKDGMDISLVALERRDTENETLLTNIQWSGANNPLWIIRMENGESTLTEIKPDKQPIGKYADNKSFTAQNIELKKGDTIYVFTDGFADQFGGPDGKKFKAANFKKLLLSVQHEHMDRQKELILQAYETWKGDLEQIDDICVIGVKI